MTFEDFTNSIVQVHQHRPDSLTYAILGVAGEAGEVAEAYKKALRVMTPDFIVGYGIHKDAPKHRARIIDELGDVLWYIAKVAKELNVPLSEVAFRNMAKLEARRRVGKK